MMKWIKRRIKEKVERDRKKGMRERALACYIRIRKRKPEK